MSFTVEVLLAALGTYLLRVSVIAAAAGRSIPPRVRSTLRLIPAAVLPALVAEALVFEGDAIRPFGPWYLALGVSVLIAARTRSVGWTLLGGMASVWAFTALWSL